MYNILSPFIRIPLLDPQNLTEISVFHHYNIPNMAQLGSRQLVNPQLPLPWKEYSINDPSQLSSAESITFCLPSGTLRPDPTTEAGSVILLSDSADS